MTPLLGPENDAKKSPPKTGFSVDFDPGRPYKAKKKKIHDASKRSFWNSKNHQQVMVFVDFPEKKVLPARFMNRPKNRTQTPTGPQKERQESARDAPDGNAKSVVNMYIIAPKCPNK